MPTISPINPPIIDPSTSPPGLSRSGFPRDWAGWSRRFPRPKKATRGGSSSDERAHQADTGRQMPRRCSRRGSAQDVRPCRRSTHKPPSRSRTRRGTGPGRAKAPPARGSAGPRWYPQLAGSASRDSGSLARRTETATKVVSALQGSSPPSLDSRVIGPGLAGGHRGHRRPRQETTANTMAPHLSRDESPSREGRGADPGRAIPTPPESSLSPSLQQ